MIIAEVCANSVQSCIEAQKGGASRVELCDNLMEGGTTPALSQIILSRQSIDIQLNVIIRPRGGDFCYDNLEFETMKLDIHHCGQNGCDGIVIGILNPDGSIDKMRNKILIDIAHQYDMSITFHRAFDRTPDLYQALEDIIELGCDRILTSGGEKTAPEGRNTIKQLVNQSNNQIIIMPGGGITSNNIAELAQDTGIKEFHGSFRKRYEGKMQFVTDKLGSFNDEYTILQTDYEEVKKSIENANSIY
jgi:copper homeostasis protein